MFKDRVIAITGAGSGIGRALAVHLGQQGATLALSDIDEDGLSATAAELQESGVACHTRLVDVSKAPEVSAWCDDVIKEFGQVDGIINNAGVSVIDGAEFVSHEDFEWLMGINFWGVIYGTQTFLPHLRKNSGCVYRKHLQSIRSDWCTNAGCLQRIEICGARLYRGPSSRAPWEHYPRCSVFIQGAYARILPEMHVII